MISELLLTFLLTLSNNSSCYSLDDVLVDFSLSRTDVDNVFLTEEGTYLAIFSNSGRENENDRSSQTNYASLSNKYIKIGENISYSNSNYMKIGEEPLFNIGGGSTVYKTAYKLNLSNLPDYYLIQNAGLLIYRFNGTLESLSCYKISNSTYDNLTGTSTYSSSYVTSVSKNLLSNSYNINLTNQIVASLENGETYLSVILEGTQTNKMGSFYSTDSPSYFPLIYVEYATSYFGNALPYSDIQNHVSSLTNCVGYTKYSANPIYLDDDFNSSLGNSTSVTYNYLISNAYPYVVNQFNGSLSTRLLASYNSPICPSERRIAFRVKLDSTGRFYDGDYHFVCQCADGSWACKFGTGDAGNFLGENAPETSSAMWYNWAHASDIVYFAYQGGNN